MHLRIAFHENGDEKQWARRVWAASVVDLQVLMTPCPQAHWCGLSAGRIADAELCNGL